jgi:molybdopterin-containing oxidoreductase family iron-sulfur binding subunit
MEELGTKPRVYYLPPKNRTFPFEGDLIDHGHEA